MSNDIVKGSIGSLAKQTGKSIAQSFVNVDAMIIVDVSGSMDLNDSRGGNTRYDVACEELDKLQGNMPGKLAVIAFSDEVQFCPSGRPPFFGNGTDLTAALRFCKVADIVDGMKFVVISDGDPNDKETALDVARSYKNPIDVIYVGPENDPSGRNFLKKLASVSGGQIFDADRAKLLETVAAKLLLEG